LINGRESNESGSVAKPFVQQAQKRETSEQGEHMKSKMHIVVTALTVSLIAVLLCAPAAHSEDWSITVNGYKISCTLQDLQKTSLGAWTSFNLKYQFCDSNYLVIHCDESSNGAFKDDTVACDSGQNPLLQVCNHASFTFEPSSINMFPISPGTVGAKSYVCKEQFKRMNVTVKVLGWW
jgi:hypothetical protein